MRAVNDHGPLTSWDKREIAALRTKLEFCLDQLKWIEEPSSHWERACRFDTIRRELGRAGTESAERANAFRGPVMLLCLLSYRRTHK